MRARDPLRLVDQNRFQKNSASDASPFRSFAGATP
jgi:hypothetical protein